MELLLTRYALERPLHRLSLTPHRERFLLKGAMLLATWFDEQHRATRDTRDPALVGHDDKKSGHQADLMTREELQSGPCDY